MKLDEAIKIADERLPIGNERLSTDFGIAVKLLIEAGKRLQARRGNMSIVDKILLPSETEE